MSSKKIAASVAKLVDATDSKSVDSNIMLVQVRPEVPKHTTPILGVVCLFVSKHLCWFGGKERICVPQTGRRRRSRIK